MTRWYSLRVRYWRVPLAVGLTRLASAPMLGALTDGGSGATLIGSSYSTFGSPQRPYRKTLAAANVSGCTPIFES